MVILHKSIPNVLSSLVRGIVLPTPAQQWRSKSTSNTVGRGSQDQANAKLMNELPPPMEQAEQERGEGEGEGEGEGRGSVSKQMQ